MKGKSNFEVRMRILENDLFYVTTALRFYPYSDDEVKALIRKLESHDFQLTNSENDLIHAAVGNYALRQKGKKRDAYALIYAAFDPAFRNI